ncbi:hypothetical protein F5Y19DRAFT_142344 [Xylariaceae sp. FL1651]|nr:hypothetical protein F5Y19DRAFT_142344 [Xylariaceae sp. FL1651]
MKFSTLFSIVYLIFKIQYMLPDWRPQFVASNIAGITSGVPAFALCRILTRSNPNAETCSHVGIIDLLGFCYPCCLVLVHPIPFKF